MQNQIAASWNQGRFRSNLRGRTIASLVIWTLIIGAAVAVGAYLKSRPDTSGLDGMWRVVTDAKHAYRFKANGDIEASYESLPMGRFMTWERDGTTITVRTIHAERPSGDRVFIGELKGKEIIGKATVSEPNGKIVSTEDEVWRKD